MAERPTSPPETASRTTPFRLGNATIFIGGSSVSRRQWLEWLCHHDRRHSRQQHGTAAGNPWRRSAGSGIFTQSGGVNVGYVAHTPGVAGPTNFSSLQVGPSSGGYGEYDLRAAR